MTNLYCIQMTAKKKAEIAQKKKEIADSFSKKDIKKRDTLKNKASR